MYVTNSSLIKEIWLANKDVNIEMNKWLARLPDTIAGMLQSLIPFIIMLSTNLLFRNINHFPTTYLQLYHFW